MIGNPSTRREFLATVSAATVALSTNKLTFADGSPAAPPRVSSTSPVASTEKTLKHRVQFGCWINDMRNEVLPRTNWPAMTLDNQTERDIIDTLQLGHESGYNQIDVWGLFVSSAYPIDIQSAFRDARASIASSPPRDNATSRSSTAPACSAGASTRSSRKTRPSAAPTRT
jgi:hypothetical protein